MTEFANRLAQVEAERDAAQAHLSLVLRENAPEPDGHAGTLTGDLAADMAAYAERLKIRAEKSEHTLACVRALVECWQHDNVHDAWLQRAVLDVLNAESDEASQ